MSREDLKEFAKEQIGRKDKAAKQISRNVDRINKKAEFRKKKNLAWARRKIVAKRSSGSAPPILPKGIRRIEKKPMYSVLTGRRLD